ncbi:MAG: SsrA-binding protein SmpB [Deltaproteobacteria bacterium]|nr:SsrA-binding protein SmpB [Deltaproteobacteria bacterium]
MAAETASENIKIIAVNKRARFDFHIIETFEAGMVLTGAEIKSIRAGGVSIAESYVSPAGGEVYLLGANITLYSHSGAKEYDPIRKRKLLLHAHEISKLRTKVGEKGYTIVPLKIYLKNGRAKIEIALAKGKDAPDKRQSIKAKEGKREIDRAMKKQK